MAYIGFDKLKAKLGHQKGVTNPGALAASIGRKKYGKKAFQKHAAAHESLRGIDAAIKSDEGTREKKGKEEKE